MKCKNSHQIHRSISTFICEANKSNQAQYWNNISEEFNSIKNKQQHSKVGELKLNMHKKDFDYGKDKILPTSTN